MTISPFDPLRFPRYPLNNITPFTYRDGRTFLQLIESLKKYINEDYVAAVNGLLDELNLATEESIVGIEATFNSQLATFNATVDTLINETETEIANKILSVDSQVSAKLATVDTAITNMTTTVNNAVADMNENATVQIALVNSTMQGYMDDIDDQIAIINEKSGPVGVQEVLLTGDYVLNHNPLFPFTHPINYMFVQNATGGHKVIAGDNVHGQIEINSAPLSWTRVTMYPAEGNSWIVETSTDRAAELLTDIVHKSFDWAVQSGRQDLTSTVMYNTFPCATRTDSGRIIVGWPAQAGHVMIATDVSYLKWSDDNGATWSNPVALPAGHGIIGLASLGNRVAMVTMRIDAPYRRMFVSFSTASTIATTWTPPMDIGNVLYSTWHFPCSISWFDDGTPDGLIIVNSYNDNGVFLTASRNGGATWYTHSQPSALAWNAGPNESSVCLTDNGTMALFMRDDSGSPGAIRMRESSDWGETWGPQITIATSATGMPKAVLMPNGQITIPIRDQAVDEYPDSYALLVVDRDLVVSRKHVSTEYMMYGHVVVVDNTTALIIGAHQVSSTHAIVWKRTLALTATEPGVWETYPVEWKTVSGSTLNIVDGTLEGRFIRQGKTVHGFITFIRGANSNYGPSTGNNLQDAFSFSLPVNPRGWREVWGNAMVGNNKPCTVWSWAPGRITLIDSTGLRVSNTNGVWDTGTEIRIGFTCEEA